jgi:ribosomal protein L37E
MDELFCPECKRKIFYKGSETCPSCGYPLKENKDNSKSSFEQASKIKNNNSLKTFAIIGMIIGLIFIIMSFTITVPAADARDYTRYVGGDAYNFIIEAALRGGEISGARTAKAIYLTGGAIIFCGSLIAVGFSTSKK